MSTAAGSFWTLLKSRELLFGLHTVRTWQHSYLQNPCTFFFFWAAQKFFEESGKRLCWGEVCYNQDVRWSRDCFSTIVKQKERLTRKRSPQRPSVPHRKMPSSKAFARPPNESQQTDGLQCNSWMSWLCRRKSQWLRRVESIFRSCAGSPTAPALIAPPKSSREANRKSWTRWTRSVKSWRAGSWCACV